MRQGVWSPLNENILWSSVAVKAWKYRRPIFDVILLSWRGSPKRARAALFCHTQWHTTVGRTSLYGWSARRRDLYLTTHSTHKRQTPIPPMGFEPAVQVSRRPLGQWDRSIVYYIQLYVSASFVQPDFTRVVLRFLHQSCWAAITQSI